MATKEQIMAKIKALEEDLEDCIYDPPDNEIYDIDDADIIDLQKESIESSLRYYKRLLKKL